MQRRVDSQQSEGKCKNPRSAEYCRRLFQAELRAHERQQDTTPSNHRHKSSRTNLITRTSRDKRTNEKMDVKFIYGALFSSVLAYRLMFKYSTRRRSFEGAKGDDRECERDSIERKKAKESPLAHYSF